MVLRRTLFSIVLLTLLCSFKPEEENNSEETYVAHKVGITERYGILQIEDTIAYLELYTKYKGDVVPINMSWNSKIEPQMFVLNRSKSDSTTTYYKCGGSEISIYKKSAEIYIENSFMGEIAMHLHRVDKMPNKFDHLRNHAYMFTGRNAVGYNFKKTGIGYDNYDKMMKGHLLFKERDQMAFGNFAVKYDSVQTTIYKQLYMIQDSVTATNLHQETVEP